MATMRVTGRGTRLDLSCFSGQCFRIFGATYNIQCGFSELHLHDARWWSSAVQRYLGRRVSLLSSAALLLPIQMSSDPTARLRFSPTRSLETDTAADTFTFTSPCVVGNLEGHLA